MTVGRPVSISRFVVSSPVPSVMKAVIAPPADGNDMLVMVDRPVPEPRAGEVLVKVAAAGVNRPDILQRRGLYPPPPGAPDILGLELAGTVVETGEGVAQVRERLADLLARRVLEDVGEVSLGVRVAGGEEGHVVTCVGEPVGKQRDDPLDPAVAARRDGEPNRAEDRDPHRVHHER